MLGLSHVLLQSFHARVSVSAAGLWTSNTVSAVYVSAMRRHIRSVRASVATHLALKGLVVGMGTLVGLQGIEESKSLLAKSAFVPLLARVCLDMVAQLLRRLEGPRTHIAFVRSISRVPLHVPLEVVLGGRRVLRAQHAAGVLGLTVLPSAYECAVASLAVAVLDVLV